MKRNFLGRGGVGRAMGFAGAVVAVVAGSVAGGCQAKRTQATPVGASEFRFVERRIEDVQGKAIAATEAKDPVEVLEAARPVPPLALPRYPESARGKQKVPMTVGVRITVATDGTVSDVTWSPLVISTPGEWAPEFRAAVDVAIAEWRFLPAELRHMVPRRGGPQGFFWHVVRVEKMEATLDVEFTFTASGEVMAVDSKSGR